VEGGQIRAEEVTEEAISSHLYTAGMPDPDLLIRTAGEMRLSNFLLWQVNYAELWVTETCWPEFDEQLLHNAICDFASRDRRFGGLNN
jgi:undecaprenyl diphosphate synthase